MAEISPQDMASRLLQDRFTRTGPVADALTDPIADTPMIVTLDELRPYELDPRITRNPLYDDILASIRERGLDTPPPITRRPGATHYIIRNGGNTRLAVLRELWAQTKDERFFRIGCLFRPWPQRGEIVALTGHLAENELHGGLSFIEQALGIEKVRELYEEEDGKPLSQSELARRLKSDGYPVPQPHISRMQEAIQYLLPAIPNVLYGGLGRHQVEQLTALRRTGTKIWEARAASSRLDLDFPTLFQDVLSVFDASPGQFNVQRVQDELVGQMADLLGEKYDTLAFDITASDKRWQLLSSEPGSVPAIPAMPAPPELPPPPRPSPATSPIAALPAPRTEPSTDPSEAVSPPEPLTVQARNGAFDEADDHAARVRGHVVSPAPTSDRLQSIQRLVADHLGEAPPDFESNVLQAIPVQAGGLYPVSDIWYIDPGLDTPERLRTLIAQLALEIADEAELSAEILPSEDGIGFHCAQDSESIGERASAPFPRTILSLLHALSAPFEHARFVAPHIDTVHLANHLGPLLQGPGLKVQFPRLSDNGLVKLFRLVRLARRLLDIEASLHGDSAMPSP
ncbi:ParB family protein [Acidovorax sp. NCPPB 3576]|uniref:ParB family protein n=1 Tax=Acidovorax sp. NCPPB 3576 TaxID=2940488 RepID=UPI00234BC319|nr:ParB family protein [Acidovorax sp. NCPPB 3576]WCM86813.1 ParB family protein [Acidovorax sp. NCPPB 3576]